MGLIDRIVDLLNPSSSDSGSRETPEVTVEREGGTDNRRERDVDAETERVVTEPTHSKSGETEQDSRTEPSDTPPDQESPSAAESTVSGEETGPESETKAGTTDESPTPSGDREGASESTADDPETESESKDSDTEPGSRDPDTAPVSFGSGTDEPSPDEQSSGEPERTEESLPGEREEPLEESEELAGEEPVHSIKGIGEAYAERLNEAGVSTVSDLAGADPEEIASEADVSEKRVSRWVERATQSDPDET